MGSGTTEILLVEDNPADVYLVRSALNLGKLPKNISVVTDGDAALAFVRRQYPYEDKPRPDLVILDLNLPKLDGREVLDSIKADPELRHIPVIVLSTSSAEGDIAGAYDRRANCYLSKPNDLDMFLDTVQEIEHYWLKYVAHSV